MTIDQAIENLQKIREKLTPHCKTTVFVQVVIDLNEQIEAKKKSTLLTGAQDHANDN